MKCDFHFPNLYDQGVKSLHFILKPKRKSRNSVFVIPFEEVKDASGDIKEIRKKFEWKRNEYIFIGNFQITLV